MLSRPSSLALPGGKLDSPRFREMIQVALDTVQTISAALGYRSGYRKKTAGMNKPLPQP
ncbi:MAG: hypothetical protein R3F53_14965 [Gammaproteobacteria bacterium]